MRSAWQNEASYSLIVYNIMYLCPVQVDDPVQGVELVQGKWCCQAGVGSGTICGWCGFILVQQCKWYCDAGVGSGTICGWCGLILVQSRWCCQAGVGSGTICGLHGRLILEGPVDAHHLPFHCGYTHNYTHAHHHLIAHMHETSSVL